MQQPASDFSRIIKEYASRVYNHAYRMLGSREDAEEAVQDVFRKVHAGLSEFRGDAKLTLCLSRPGWWMKAAPGIPNVF